jgi:sec-independent protein translocase protein TatB
MDILGVGPLELLVILVLILIFVGPERLPEVARQIGKVYRQLHEMSRMVAAQWQEELSAAAELEGEKKDLRKALSEPLQAAKADAERMLASSLSTSVYEQPGNAKPATAGNLTSTAPDGRAGDEIPASVAPLETTPEQVGRVEEALLPPDIAAPAIEATEADTSISPEDPEKAPPVNPPSDGSSEYGN